MSRYYSLARYRLLLALVCLHVITVTAQTSTLDTPLPQGFIYLEEFIPNITVDLRYYSDHNFVGQRINGYLAPKAILTGKAAKALKAVQQELNASGLGLKIYDAYRPQQAVNHFIRWAKDLKDTKTKAEFYPDVAKKNLFKEGYIDAKSTHSRGSTLDLTIIHLAASPPDNELDMGTPFDFFSPKSWLASRAVTIQQRANRLLLYRVMKKHGFKYSNKEWWHFTLRNEPYPKTYFDFPVR